MSKYYNPDTNWRQSKAHYTISNGVNRFAIRCNHCNKFVSWRKVYSAYTLGKTLFLQCSHCLQKLTEPR